MKLTQKILFNKDECDSIISNQIENMINWNMNDRQYTIMKVPNGYLINLNIFLKLKLI
jgi:hypothetical protein